MAKTQSQFIEYLGEKPDVFDVGAVGNGVVVLRDNSDSAARFDDAKENGWYLSLWDSKAEYNLAVFMPITGANMTDDTHTTIRECDDCDRLIQVPSDHETFCPSKGTVVE